MKNHLELQATQVVNKQFQSPIQKKEEPVLITRAELRIKLKLKTNSPTIWRYQKRGMPYIKNGTKIYYEYDKVVKWLGGKYYDR